MKTYAKFFIFMVFVGVLSAVTAQLLSQISDLGFQKILHRCAVIYSFIGLIVFRLFIQKKSIASLGLIRHKGWVRNIIIGFGISFISISIMIAVSVLAGARSFAPDFTVNKLLSYLFLNIAAVALIGLFEELFFRGFIFQIFLQDLPVMPAVFITNLFYAIVHFLKPADNLPLTFSKMAGLFFLGLVFTYAFLKTKSLFLSIGMHAGLVYFVKLQKLFFQINPKANELIWGDKLLIGGVVSWLVLILVVLIIKKIPKTEYAK